MYNLGVLQGRFSPPTEAHVAGVIRPALKQVDELIVNIGSCFAPPSLRNPWNGSTRKALLRSCLTQSENERIVINEIPDFLYNDNKWLETVNSVVKPHATPTSSVALVGHSKDKTSYYLKLFPQWDSIDVANYKGINSSDIRRYLFDVEAKNPLHTWEDEIRSITYPAVFEFLESWVQTETYAKLRAEQRRVIEYHQKYGEGPFMTGDGVVFQAGHVLMIRRGDNGMLALPGGFLDMTKNETLLECAIRETHEETKIDIPMGALRGYYRAGHIFDIPWRDPRARIITFAAAFDLDNELDRKARAQKDKTSALNLTKVKGADDATDALWVNLSDLNSEEVYADHYHIIRKMETLLDRNKTI